MKKRLLAVLLVLALALSLTACGGGLVGGYKPSKEWKQIYNEAMALVEGEGYPWDEILNLANKAIFCDPAAAEGYILASQYALDDADAYAYLLLAQQRAADQEAVEQAITQFRANKYVVTPQEAISASYDESAVPVLDSEGRVVAFADSEDSYTWSYDADGRIAMYVCDSMYYGVISSSYTYNEDGLLVSAVQNGGGYYDREERTYDPLAGRLLQTDCYDDTYLAETSLYTYEGDTVTVAQTSYRESGDKSGETVYRYALPATVDLYISVYEVLENGDKASVNYEEVSVEMEAWFESSDLPVSAWYRYPLLLSEERYYEDGDPWYKYEYTYWLPQDSPDVWSPTEKSELNYEWNSAKNDWVLEEEIYYKENGDETLEVTYSWGVDGTLLEEERIEYLYGEGEESSRIQQKVYTKTEGESVTETVTCDYTYNAEGQKTQEMYVVLDAGGNVVNTLSIFFEYTEDDWSPCKESYYLNDELVVTMEDTDSGEVYTYADGTTDEGDIFDGWNWEVHFDYIDVINNIQWHFW